MHKMWSMMLTVARAAVEAYMSRGAMVEGAALYGFGGRLEDINLFIGFCGARKGRRAHRPWRKFFKN